MTRGERSRPSPARIMIDPWDRWPTRATPSREAIIIGAGLAGCACARSLAERGWSATVVDDAVAAGASAVPVAIFKPHGGNPDDPIAACRNTAFAHASRLLCAFSGHANVSGCGIHTVGDDGSVMDLPGGTVEPRLLCDALLDHPAITVRSHFAVARLDKTASTWRISDQSGNELNAPFVIIANSMHAKDFEQLARARLPHTG